MELNSYIGVLSVNDKTVVTSAAYQRYFIQDNKKYHHIIDPRTGYPAETDLTSATIVSDVSIDADALSTGIFVLGLQKSIKILAKLKNIDAVLMTKNKDIYVTKGLEKHFKSKDKSNNIYWI